MVRAPHAVVLWPSDMQKWIAVGRIGGRMTAGIWPEGHVYHQELLLVESQLQKMYKAQKITKRITGAETNLNKQNTGLLQKGKES